jgi:hypothetical protein
MFHRENLGAVGGRLRRRDADAGDRRREGGEAGEKEESPRHHCDLRRTTRALLQME